MWSWLAGGWMTGWWGFALQTVFCFTVGPVIARTLYPKPKKVRPPKPEREMLLRARGVFVRF